MASIEIKDFKNITDAKKYNFNKDELCHLIGASGAGKTTILTAFEWCLYGKINGIKAKSQKNPIPEVKITLEDGTVIHRESNDLKVVTRERRELSLDAAQGYIFTIFGTKNLWKSMSYLEQGNRNIILTGTAEEKISLLRELVYGYGISEDNDPDYYLSRTAAFLKKISKEKDKINIEYQSYNEDFEKYREKNKESEKRWKKSRYEHQNLDKNIDKISSEIKKISLNISKSETIEKELETLRKKYDKISVGEEIPEEDIEDIIKRTQNSRRKKKSNERNKKIEEFLPFEYNTSRYQDLINNERKYSEWISEINSHKLPTDKKSLKNLLSNVKILKIMKNIKNVLKRSRTEKNLETKS